MKTEITEKDFLDAVAVGQTAMLFDIGGYTVGRSFFWKNKDRFFKWVSPAY